MKGKFIPGFKEEKITPWWLRWYVYWRLIGSGGSYIDKDGKEWSLWY